MMQGQDNYARKIQDAWRRYLEKKTRMYEDEEPFIPCCMCGANCADGDYPRWQICSRSCMVASSREDR